MGKGSLEIEVMEEDNPRELRINFNLFLAKHPNAEIEAVSHAVYTKDVNYLIQRHCYTIWYREQKN